MQFQAKYPAYSLGSQEANIKSHPTFCWDKYSVYLAVLQSSMLWSLGSTRIAVFGHVE
jgi:hypothetical protein